MSNISDHDIDNLFRKAADNYNTTFDEKAWAAMNDRLDGGIPKPTLGYYKTLSVVVGLFIAAWLLIWWRSGSDTAVRQPISTVETTQDEPLGERAPGLGTENPTLEVTQDRSIGAGEEEKNKLISSLGENFTQEDTEPVLTDQKKDNLESAAGQAIDIQAQSARSGNKGGSIELPGAEPVSSTGTGPQGVPTGEGNEDRSAEATNSVPVHKQTNGKNRESTAREKPLVVSYDPGQVGQDNVRVAKGEAIEEGQRAQEVNPGLRYTGLQQEKQPSTGKVALSQELQGRLSVRPSTLYSAEEAGPDSLQTIREDFLHALLLPNVDLQGVDQDAQRTDNSGNEEEDAPARPVFSLKLALAPDLSSVGYFEPDRPGSNIGLIAEYYLGKRWSISSGVIRSHKIYFSDEREGYSGGASWNSEWRLDAECVVLDIPINLSYYIKQNTQHNLLFTFGFSSYLMLVEDYEYFEEVGGNPRWWDERIEGENNHFFSMLNLSFAYERRLRKNLFFQVEPFVKAPISGVGEGEVDLVSSGLFLSLKYNFLKP